jgi:drug/metabolite transporter (DMT)-like permease
MVLTTDTFLISSVSHLPGFTLQFYRFFFAGITVLAVLVAILRQSFLSRVRNIGKIQIYASVTFLLGNLFFTMAVLSTSAANVLVCQSINPIFSAFFSYALLNELIPKRTMIAFAICFAAILWIFIVESQDSASGGLEGNLLALLSSFLMGESFSLLQVASQVDK